MKQLVSFCIKHRVTTMMACIVIVVFGVMGFGFMRCRSGVMGFGGMRSTARLAD